VTASTGIGRSEGGRIGGAKGNVTYSAKARARIENAHWLVHDLGEHPEVAAARLRVSVKTMERYLATPLPLAGDPETGTEDEGQDAACVALEPERRVRKAMPLAADLIRCVAAEDAQGVEIVLHKVRDWFAFAVVLAAARDGELARPAVAAGAGMAGSGRAAGRRDEDGEAA
jgi:hypothetical protein